MPLKGSSLELCKKAFACQRAKDLTEQASALLAKDKQIEALQQECRELQAKLIAGKVRNFWDIMQWLGKNSAVTMLGTTLQQCEKDRLKTEHLMCELVWEKLGKCVAKMGSRPLQNSMLGDTPILTS